MRPIRLEISAFGPYAGTEVVDFRELRGKRFFLITGPTGAGKTSVLDAMTFALYGDTTGDERTGTDMRSLLAAPTALTQVTFDFSVGPRSFRVWRKPAQQRPKQRGEGMTAEKPDAGLWERTHVTDDAVEGENIASGVRDVDAHVQELLGFDCDQFRQVVVLPQGRFREVLSADVKTREAILRQLFKTDRFARITDYLKSARNESRRAIDEMVAKRKGVLENAGVETCEELEELGVTATAAEKDAQQAAEVAGKAAQTAATLAEAARSAKGALDEVAAAERALAMLREEEPCTAEKRADLEAAKRAASVQPAHDAVSRTDAELAQTREELERTEAAMPALAKAAEQACALEAEAKKAQSDAREVEKLDAAAARARSVADDVERLEKLRSEAAKAQEGVAASGQVVETAERAVAEAAHACEVVESRWRASQAAVLAASLHDGEPCPVCGSTEHPVPATPGAEAVGEAELQSARAAEQQARAQLAGAHARATAQVEALEAANGRVGEEIARMGESAAIEVAAARNAAIAAGEAAERKRAEVRKAELDLEQCEKASAKAAEALASAKGSAKTLGERAGALTEALEKARVQLADALAIADFADEAAFAAARRTPVEVDALEGAVSSFDTQLAAGVEREKRARLAAKGVSAAEDLVALEAAEATTRAVADEAARALGEARTRAEAVRDALATIERYEGDTSDLNARHQLVARIADVADGSNELKLSFQRYVLGAYLDEVLSHANYHLQLMTGGRYRLERSTEVGHRGRPAGLALSVHDEQAGESRPAGTLSGGEGFLASLALALGLAEAVQRHAGGVKLETIFVDEGFGTLDPEALEMAISMLLGLAGVAAEQGRLVGIISHVPELKDRIDARLEITPGERGSSTRFVV